MPPTIKVVYELKPPSSVDTAEKPPTQAYEFKLENLEEGHESESAKQFYKGLLNALEIARSSVGVDLTEWRDLVGKAEANKEPKGKAKNGEGDVDIEEEEEEES